MIVVPVFITNCQVSLNPKTGPVIPQTTIVRNARTNVTGLPVTLAVAFENRVKNDCFAVGIFCFAEQAVYGSLLANSKKKCIKRPPLLTAVKLKGDN